MRRVGDELLRFLFMQFQHYYYLRRHGIGGNNHERQGLLTFEDVYRPRELKRFGRMIGCVLVNAHMTYKYVVNNPVDHPREHKTDSLRER